MTYQTTKLAIITKIIVINGLSKAVGNKKKNARALELAIVSPECHLTWSRRLDRKASAKQNDMEKT